MTVAAGALAWISNISGTGVLLALQRPIPVFTGVMLTAFTVAAAAIPRAVYAWLQRASWFSASLEQGLINFLLCCGGALPFARFRHCQPGLDCWADPIRLCSRGSRGRLSLDHPRNVSREKDLRTGLTALRSLVLAVCPSRGRGLPDVVRANMPTQGRNRARGGLTCWFRFFDPSP